jgi:hypothetical protein
VEAVVTALVLEGMVLTGVPVVVAVVEQAVVGLQVLVILHLFLHLKAITVAQAGQGQVRGQQAAAVVLTHLE